MKAMVKAQSAERAENFGAANAANRDLGVCFEKNSGVTTYDRGDEVGLKALKGYFDNVAASTNNEKTVLEQLVASNAKLATKNEELVAVVKS